MIRKILAEHNESQYLSKENRLQQKIKEHEKNTKNYNSYPLRLNQ
jgi:hypothetical protein